MSIYKYLNERECYYHIMDYIFYKDTPKASVLNQFINAESQKDYYDSECYKYFDNDYMRKLHVENLNLFYLLRAAAICLGESEPILNDVYDSDISDRKLHIMQKDSEKILFDVIMLFEKEEAFTSQPGISHLSDTIPDVLSLIETRVKEDISKPWTEISRIDRYYTPVLDALVERLNTDKTLGHRFFFMCFGPYDHYVINLFFDTAIIKHYDFYHTLYQSYNGMTSSFQNNPRTNIKEYSYYAKRISNTSIEIYFDNGVKIQIRIRTTQKICKGRLNNIALNIKAVIPDDLIITREFNIEDLVPKDTESDLSAE